MRIRIGYELIYECPRDTPMILTLHVHPSRRSDLIVEDRLVTEPTVTVSCYHDAFNNLCTRLTMPRGRVRLTGEGIIEDSGEPDRIAPHAREVPIDQLPDETLVFLLGSRYCETDELSPVAWNLFGQTAPGWSRVQAISDFVHGHLRFGYEFARPTKSALGAFHEKRGVCRDFTHLAIAFCRSMNIPARYCTGYVSDIGMPPPYAPMDFAAWFEAYLDGGWYAFDPRNHTPRIGRILIARGRDAADVPISNSFGPSFLKGFTVWTEEAAAVSVQ